VGAVGFAALALYGLSGDFNENDPGSSALLGYIAGVAGALMLVFGMAAHTYGDNVPAVEGSVQTVQTAQLSEPSVPALSVR